MELARACSVGDVETLYLVLSQQADTVSLVNLTSEGDVTLLMKTIIGAGKLTWSARAGCNTSAHYLWSCPLSHGIYILNSYPQMYACLGQIIFMLYYRDI